MEYTLSVTDVADPANRLAIAAPLVEYNTSHAGPSQYRHLAVLLRDRAGNVVGGVWGNTAYDWLAIYLLCRARRRREAGESELSSCGWQRARRPRAGCRGVWLDTLEFQARGFYEHIGYVCLCELPHYPSGYSKYFMKKEFGASVVSS